MKTVHIFLSLLGLLVLEILLPHTDAPLALIFFFGVVEALAIAIFFMRATQRDWATAFTLPMAVLTVLILVILSGADFFTRSR